MFKRSLSLRVPLENYPSSESLSLHTSYIGPKPCFSCENQGPQERGKEEEIGDSSLWVLK